MLSGLILSGVLAAVPSQLPSQSVVVIVPSSPTSSSPSSVSEKPGPAFSRLFQGGSQPEVKPQPQPQVRARRERSKVVCGMTLILVGPEADPDMPKPAPNDDGIKYTMRRYPPPACGAGKTENKKR